MPTTVMKRWSSETYTRPALSWFNEWNNKELLRKLNRKQGLLVEGNPEFFHPYIATNTDIIDFIVRDEFWQAPIFYIGYKTKLATENSTHLQKSSDEKLSEFLRAFERAYAPVIEQEEMLDWDAHIETPPSPYRSGTIKVMFKYIGRSKPIPIDDPWA